MKSLTSTPTGNVVPVVNYSAGSYTLTGLTVGQNYYYSMGANDTSIAFSGGATFAKSARATGVFTATQTSATLAGSGSSAVGTLIYPVLGVPLYATTVTPSTPLRQVTIGQYTTANPNWVRNIQVSDQYVFIKRGSSAAVAITLADMVNIGLSDELGLTWTPPVINTPPSAATCAGTAQSTATLTWDNVSGPSDGETVTIGTKVYTFKTTLGTTEGQVFLNGGGDAALLNLIRAINHTGTPNTDYFCAAANTQVTAASSVTAHAFAITAITSGLAGNLIATTETSAHLSWGGSVMSGGTDAAATFTVAAGSEYSVTYQWQYSSNGGSSWASAMGTVNGTAYTNDTTATLTCTPTTTGQNGYLHRCVVTDNAGSFGLTNGSVNSPSAKLTIS